MNTPPKNTLFEVWQNKTADNGRKIWELDAIYEGEAPAEVKKIANEHYRQAREDFSFPGYVIRDADTKEPLWCSRESTSWKPVWVDVREALCQAGPNAHLFFRPVLPTLGTAVIEKESGLPAFVIGTSGQRLEKIHLLFQDGSVKNLGDPAAFWKHYDYLQNVSLPKALARPHYAGPSMFLSFQGAGSFDAVWDEADKAQGRGEILTRRAGSFVAPNEIGANGSDRRPARRPAVIFKVDTRPLPEQYGIKKPFGKKASAAKKTVKTKEKAKNSKPTTKKREGAV